MNMEKWFSGLVNGQQFDVIWKILKREKSHNPLQIWYWCIEVMRAFQDMEKENQYASIENAYERLIGISGIPGEDYTLYEKESALVAIFAVLCWTTMTLKPVLSRERTGSELQTYFMAERSSQIHLRQARRPVAKMFRGFKEQAKEQHTQVVRTSTTIDMDSLYESNLNFFSLYTIGRFRLKWVDTLTSHLEFDRQTRTISIFRFPSVCVSGILCR